MERKIYQQGVSVIEALLAVAIFSLLVYLASISFIQIQQSHLINDNLWQIASVIRENQSRAASAEGTGGNQFRFGVVFTQDSYQEFATLTNYAVRELTYDFTNDLPSSLAFSDFNLPNDCLQSHDCLIFSVVEATLSASGTISLENLKTGEKKGLSINAQGQVNF